MRERLNADSEDVLQGEQFAEADGRPALADFKPQRLGGHEERAGEAVRDPFSAETAGDGEHDVAQFVGDGESLALAPVLGVHDDERDGLESGPTRSRGETADAAEREGEYLDASFFQKLDQVRNGLVAKAPVVAERVGVAVRFDGIAQYGIGRVPRLVPLGAGKSQDLLNGEIAFEMREHRGFDLGFATLRREGVFPEFEILKDQIGVAEQIVDGRIQDVGERNQDAAARHRLVAFVFADGLSSNAVADRRRQAAERKSGGPPCELESYSDHSFPPRH